MKWNILINQRMAIALGLKNTTDAIILGMICDCHSWAEPQVIENTVYYWTARQEFVRQLPILGLKEDTVYRYLKNLEKLGIIEYKKLGKKDCVRLTKRGKSYYVGKKSGLDEATISEKYPSKHGKKSEIDPEKYPTYSLIKNHSTINDSSSSLPPPFGEDEEEGVISTELVPNDPYSSIPSEGMDGLPNEVIISGIEQLVKANAGDEGTYREALIREVLSGAGRTLKNIRKSHRRPRIGSNRGEPALPPGVTIFQLIEEWSNDAGGDA